MKRIHLAAAIALPVLALGIHFVSARTPAVEQGLRGGSFDPPHDAPSFTLDGSHGKKVSLNEYRGKVVILEFGYTFCEEVCPVTLARLTEVFKRLGDSARDAQLIYVTVDPGRDTIERLREHLTAFHPRFLGVRGSPPDLEAVKKVYGVAAKRVVSPNPALPYAVDHSSSLYLIDRRGKLRGLVPFGTPAGDIAHDLALLLRESQ